MSHDNFMKLTKKREQFSTNRGQIFLLLLCYTDGQSNGEMSEKYDKIVLRVVYRRPFNNHLVTPNNIVLVYGIHPH